MSHLLSMVKQKILNLRHCKREKKESSQKNNKQPQPQHTIILTFNLSCQSLVKINCQMTLAPSVKSLTYHRNHNLKVFIKNKTKFRERNNPKSLIILNKNQRL